MRARLCSMKVVLSLTLMSTGLTPAGFAAKILFIPPNVESLVYSYARLAADLTLLGHVTHVLAPSNARLPQFIAQFQHRGNFSYTRYAVDGDQPFSNTRNVSEFLLRIAISRSPWERFFMRNELDKDFLYHCECDCIRLVENDHLMQRIRRGGYQFAVMPPVVPECFYAIPYSLGIPYGTMSAPGLAWLYRVPRLPSFSPLFRFGFTDRMSFGQRLTSFVGGSLLTLNSAEKTTTNYCDRLAPDRTSVTADQLMQQVSLWFYLEDVSVGYALPQMPNTLAVGDILAGRPGNALPRDLEDFISLSSDGVIIFSFGSYFDFETPDIVRKFCDAFTDRRHRLRVVWKTQYANICPNDGGRVKLMPWIPQNDLLADPRVIVFISHGGINSIIESVYHSKPLIIFPITVDQPFNAAAAESKGFAIQMDIGDFTSDALLSNIITLLTDPTYRRNVHLASAIMRDRRDTPAQRVSTMIDHVIKYGDRHLRTAAFELSTLQFFMFDIFAVLLASGVTVVLVVIVLCYCTCRACCALCNIGRKSKIS